METEQKNIDTILCEAVDIVSAEEREAYLDRVCGSDTVLRREAGRLIADHFEAGEFLEKPAVVPDVTIDQPITEKPGTQIGPYKLLQQIGEGGMGVVYVAEQAEPVRRKVALKIVKPGMATRDVVARFEAERQALAMMEHPHIARVVDGGETECGQPFFVMELVQGLPITHYCDQHGLSTKERLWLFLKVCRAVQHAHQKGIIHRDLKPSNVLVTRIDDESVPKIIDFGIAKAISHKLTEQTIYTRFSQMIGTPLYMSPEQAELGVIDVDTRSDVYSLGAMLYELLVGHTPFDSETLKAAGFDEMRRIIRQQEPPRPSALISTFKAEALSTLAELRAADPRHLRRSLKGEPDWITMKALEKDRNRRYESANALAADVERYLNNQPIEAGPPSVFYRMRKFAQRNRMHLLVGSLVAAVLIAGLTLAVGSKLEHDRSRRRLVEDVQQALTAARTAIDSDDLASAEQRAAEIRGRLAQTHDSPLQLAVSVEQLADEIKQRKAQQQQFQRFQALALDTWRLCEAKANAQGDLVARQTLAVYGVLNDEGWCDRLESSFLPDQQQGEVLETAYEILLLLAQRDLMDRGVRNEETVNASLRYLKCAEQFHERTRAFYMIRKNCHQFLKKWEQVKRDDELMRDSSGVTAFDYFLLGQMSADPQEAMRFYEAALNLQSDNQDTLFALARSLLRLGRAAEAAQVTRACLALRPHDPIVLMNVAYVCDRADRQERALLHFEEALELQPDDPRLCRGFAWFLISSPHRSAWDPARGVALAQRAVERAPQDKDMWSTLGAAQYRVGDFAAAIKSLTKSMELYAAGDRKADNTLFPLDEAGKERIYNALFLAMAHWQLGNHDTAHRCYDKAIEWMAENEFDLPNLLACQAEAEALLGVKTPSTATTHRHLHTPPVPHLATRQS